MPGTVIPSLTDVQFAQRIAAVFPNGWASAQAKQPGGIVFALFETLGGSLSFALSTVAYAAGSTRIGTAVAPELDLASLDFFGTGDTALPRLPGETDAQFAARIEANLFFPAATRAAIKEGVERATGNPVRMSEPWQPADSWCWGRSYWGVDTAKTPGRWASGYLPYQGFLQCTLPATKSLGNNPFWCWGNVYWNTPTFFWFDIGTQSTAGKGAIYAVINRLKVYGTVVWVQFLPYVLPPD